MASTKYFMVEQEGSTVLNIVKGKSFVYAENVCGVEYKPPIIFNLSR
jgi:hypothetical protein